jgi:hypothetical protein
MHSNFNAQHTGAPLERCVASLFDREPGREAACDMLPTLQMSAISLASDGFYSNQFRLTGTRVAGRSRGCKLFARNNIQRSALLHKQKCIKNPCAATTSCYLMTSLGHSVALCRHGVAVVFNSAAAANAPNPDRPPDRAVDWRWPPRKPQALRRPRLLVGLR